MLDASLRTLLEDALRSPTSAIPYRLGSALAASFPSRHLLETRDGNFDPWRFRRSGESSVEWHEEIHSQRLTGWQREAPHLHDSPANVWMRVRWRGDTLDVLRLEWQEGWERGHRWWVLADRRETAEAFFDAVCAYCHVPHEEILVFDGRCWSGSHEMWVAVQESSFDDLILAGHLKDEIRGDLERFLRARDDYARYRVPWKRGILFVGPAGNGKTHCLRACLRLLGVPSLYVQSLASKYETEDANIGRVFDRARELTPCCLVFEDLDAMITPKNRSFFLNQLDGFEQNDGILTLATTNHADRLDPAIVDRPSRFDRKYHFGLPAPTERAAYVTLWNGRLAAELRIEDKRALARLVEETDGFSFAYIKELFVSSMVHWMAGDRTRGMERLVFEQLLLLREQMRTEIVAPPSPPAESDPGSSP